MTNKKRKKPNLVKNFNISDEIEVYFQLKFFNIISIIFGFLITVFNSGNFILALNYPSDQKSTLIVIAIVSLSINGLFIFLALNLLIEKEYKSKKYEKFILWYTNSFLFVMILFFITFLICFFNLFALFNLIDILIKVDKESIKLIHYFGPMILNIIFNFISYLLIIFSEFAQRRIRFQITKIQNKLNDKFEDIEIKIKKSFIQREERKLRSYLEGWLDIYNDFRMKDLNELKTQLRLEQFSNKENINHLELLFKPLIIQLKNREEKKHLSELLIIIDEIIGFHKNSYLQQEEKNLWRIRFVVHILMIISAIISLTYAIIQIS